MAAPSIQLGSCLVPIAACKLLPDSTSFTFRIHLDYTTAFLTLSSSMSSPVDPVDRFPSEDLLMCPEVSEVQQGPWHRRENHDFSRKPVSGDDTWLYNTLARPVEGVRRVQHFHPKHRRHGKLSLLERLPNELIDKVIGALIDVTADFIADPMALGVSSHILYPIVLERVHRSYPRFATTSWAGKRIGFHGRWSTFALGQLHTYRIFPSIHAQDAVHH
ncbi:hypothetical protein EK21DRAFT_93323 [Setomelanomma holmii]|uniref:Uncharacterized protein n=1 Tax=Setomelanomma holmii TaxID=210430 RepID=A0A9P4H142_9PLEO|nr:hypothetical protein EK21DRAFT_93323 [Setomelanomma holmii]